MTRNQATIGLGAAGFLICVAVFLVALAQRFGWIASLACLAAWIQLIIVIATVGDALSDRQVPSSVRGYSAVLLVALIAALYAIAIHHS